MITHSVQGSGGYALAAAESAKNDLRKSETTSQIWSGMLMPWASWILFQVCLHDLDLGLRLSEELRWGSAYLSRRVLHPGDTGAA